MNFSTILDSGKPQLKTICTAILAATVLTGCGGGGDINIQPVTNDNSQDNSSTQAAAVEVENPCATYVDNGATFIGDFDSSTGNCTYPQTFADVGNNMTVNLLIPELEDGGAHIFKGSLFMGPSCSSNACLTTNGITQGGDGPTLTIEAGATLAWESKEKFLVINRGSKIIAIGTQDKPITLTSTSQLNGTAAYDAVQQWGGVVIDGFGVTNKCTYTGTRGVDLALTGECHVESEGSEGESANYYGGDNDADNSGRLEYVRTMHTGAEVVTGNELNGITFGGVGSGTVVKNLEIYSSYDDGIEMFGGAVNFENYVAMYVRDDSIDIDEGYIGTITNALVIQHQYDGNRCIEADGIGSYSNKTDAFITDMQTRKLNSAPVINNLTCIISPNGVKDADDANNENKQGTHDPGAGWRLREGIFPTITDALVVGSFGPAVSSDNWCIRVDDTAASAGFATGAAKINTSVFACETKSSKTIGGEDVNVFLAKEENGGNVFADVTAGGLDATATADTGLILLEGTPPIYSVPGTTSTPTITPTSGDTVGALSIAEPDWTAGWTYGIHEGARSAPLWFE